MPDDRDALFDAGEPGELPIRSLQGHWALLFRDVTGSVVSALLIAVMMHLFLAQSTVVFGQSMQPSLESDQRLIIEKISYHFRGARRGELVVIRDPLGSDTPLIKRVIGLPGEKVTMANGRVFIDGSPLDEPYLAGNESGDSGSWLVPPFHVFLLGDNRGNSRDSRYFGPVRQESILGHAIFRYWPANRIGLP